MEIEISENQEGWDDWLKENSQYNRFTQSWQWGDVLIGEGKKIERLAVIEGGVVLAQAQIIYSNLVFGWKYAYCPNGPVIIKNEDEIYKALIKYLKQKGCIFFRVEPEKFSDNRIAEKSIELNPPATLILDLNKTETDLLGGMHQKTRYNINLAVKKDIKIINKKDFQIFWNLMKETGKRDEFKLHGEGHYRQILNSNLSYQLTAMFEDKPVACIVCIGFGDTFSYLYGASDYNYRNLMTPYLLQWEGIKFAKSLDFKYYDFFGVAPKTNGKAEEYESDPKHQYAGVTRFKLGFGGVPYETTGTWDIIIEKNKYNLYKFLRRLRRLV